jgi:hypothetical protein
MHQVTSYSGSHAGTHVSAPSGPPRQVAHSPTAGAPGHPPEPAASQQTHGWTGTQEPVVQDNGYEQVTTIKRNISISQV